LKENSIYEHRKICAIYKCKRKVIGGTSYTKGVCYICKRKRKKTKRILTCTICEGSINDYNNESRLKLTCSERCKKLRNNATHRLLYINRKKIKEVNENE